MAAFANRVQNGEASSSTSRHPPALHRKPVFPITEIDECVDEHGNLVHECSVLLEKRRKDDRPAPPLSGLDEGDGTEAVSSTIAEPELPLFPVKRPRGKSFDKFIENLFVRAQIKVYLMDYTSIDFIPVTGYECLAREMVDIVIKKRSLDFDQGRKCLAVWFANLTDALEVQLKPHHNPFWIQKYWKYYMQRYSTVLKPNDQTPVVYVRRSIWLPVDVERQVTDHRLQHLLFHEAKSNVLSKRYALSRESVLKLGCLLIFRDNGRYSNTISPQKMQQLHDSMEGYFPSGLFPTQFANIFSSKREDTINEILSAYEMLEIRHRDDARQRYLEICQQDVLYGAAMFHGTVDVPMSLSITSLFSDQNEMSVLLAVNQRGFFVLSSLKAASISAEVLLAFSHKEISFSFREPSEEKAIQNQDTACLDLVVPVSFHNTVDSPTSSCQKRLLHIYSKQAPLIAVCVGTFQRLERAAEMQRREQVINGAENTENVSRRSVVDQPVEEITLVEESVTIPGVTFSSTTTSSTRKSGKLTPARSFAFPQITNRLDMFQFKSPHEPL
ncbi:hypothetical protein RvY_18241 [Ramazzottius varieornatus]|uniref:FERM domain-containing protein 8 n=1 Tax=Ramazzottius varieornatus TaxID=947166 RepID=A0A1D1W521_RAMVA|nr:hypothetical protein RvY_18241 [Ramazzottius varieornatus]